MDSFAMRAKSMYNEKFGQYEHNRDDDLRVAGRDYIMPDLEKSEALYRENSLITTLQATLDLLIVMAFVVLGLAICCIKKT